MPKAEKLADLHAEEMRLRAQLASARTPTDERVYTALLKQVQRRIRWYEMRLPSEQHASPLDSTT